MPGTIKITRYQSPAGAMIVGSFDEKLCLCAWTAGKNGDATGRRLCHKLQAKYEPGHSDIIQTAISQLDEYFNGKRRDFAIPVLFAGTDFQSKVWTELMSIPYGQTISYAELARRIGNPKAFRAVASANAANPVSIFVPCHRVIGSNAKLGGYGGGLQAKQMLLALEGVNGLKLSQGYRNCPLNMPKCHR